MGPKTGEPVHNAIVWQDTRVAEKVAAIQRTAVRIASGEDRLPLTTYFSGLKIRWILENVQRRAPAAKAGDLLFGNIDTYLIWNLTGGPNGGVHVTDVTNASRTQLMN